MDGTPIAATTVAALARRGVMTLSADAAAARVTPPQRGGQRVAIGWRRAMRGAGAAAVADTASLTGATPWGATGGGRHHGAADTGGKRATNGVGTEVAAATGDYLESLLGVVAGSGYRQQLPAAVTGSDYRQRPATVPQAAPQPRSTLASCCVTADMRGQAAASAAGASSTPP